MYYPYEEANDFINISVLHKLDESSFRYSPIILFFAREA